MAFVSIPGDYGWPTFIDADGDTRLINVTLTGLPTNVGDGEPTASAYGNPYLFNGRRWDAETGLYYYRNRYLEPLTGRFTTPDPIGNWGDPMNLGNAFTYTGNNPWTYVDPFGLDGSSALDRIGSFMAWPFEQLGGAVEYVGGMLFGGSSPRPRELPSLDEFEARAAAGNSEYDPDYGQYSIEAFHTTLQGARISVDVAMMFGPSGASILYEALSSAVDLSQGYYASAALPFGLSVLRRCSPGARLTGAGNQVAQTGARTAEEYENAIRLLYGGIPFAQAGYNTVANGRRVLGVADHALQWEGRSVAIEAK